MPYGLRIPFHLIGPLRVKFDITVNKMEPDKIIAQDGTVYDFKGGIGGSLTELKKHPQLPFVNPNQPRNAKVITPNLIKQVADLNKNAHVEGE